MGHLEETPDGMYAASVQALRADELELLMSFISKRDMTDKTRDALRMMLEHGYSVTFAARRAGVSYRHVTNAERKLLDMHDAIMKQYGKY